MLRWPGWSAGAGLWAAGALAVLVLVGCAGDGEPSAGDGAAGMESDGWVAAAERVRPSVHSVWGSKRALGGALSAFAPVGTAFAIGRDRLLTNAHVVVRPDSSPVPRLHVLVQTDSGSTLMEARIVALDVGRDLALLAVPDTMLRPVLWSDGMAPMGMPLATIGYGLPEGGVVDTTDMEVKTEYTVFRRFSAGYSSGYRTLVPNDPSSNVLEVDLFIFPGVSGSPTFDREGRVLGVAMGYRQFGNDSPTSYGRVVPRLVVRQFIDLNGAAAGVDSTALTDPGG